MPIWKITKALFKKTWASYYDSRNGPRWRLTRKLALIRDNHTCLACGSKKLLHGHHILGWAWYPLERFEVSNVATLCSKCHAAYHKFNGGTRVKCTEKTFNPWLKRQQRKWRKHNSDLVMNLFLMALLAGLTFWLFVLD